MGRSAIKESTEEEVWVVMKGCFGGARVKVTDLYLSLLPSCSVTLPPLLHLSPSLAWFNLSPLPPF